MMMPIVPATAISAAAKGRACSRARACPGSSRSRPRPNRRRPSPRPAETWGSGDGHDAEPARQKAEERAREGDEAASDAAMRHQLARHDEHRDGDEMERLHAAEKVR